MPSTALPPARFEQLHFQPGVPAPTNGQTIIYDAAHDRYVPSDLPFLPSQTGNDGKFLRTSGSSASWEDVTWTDLSGAADSISFDGGLRFVDIGDGDTVAMQISHGEIDFDNRNLRSVADPFSPQDAATKAYVDASLTYANPLTTLGDTTYAGVDGAPTRLAGNTTATKQWLNQTGTGSASAAPAWSAITKGDVGLGNVENTALSTWSGSTNLTTAGTLVAGVWHGTPLTSAYVPTLDGIGSPVASISLNSQKITNLADGTLSTDAASWGQTQNLVSATANGLDWKASCRVATSSNVTIASPGSTIDGVTMANGNRVLLAGQSTASQNGLYVFNGSASAMTRTTDADANAEVTSGLTCQISEGTHASSLAVLTTADPITVGTTALTFTFIAGPGAYTAGTGIDITGSTVSINTGYVGQTSITTLGTIGAGTWNATAIGITKGGTGQITAAAAFNALSPLTTVGDLLYGAASGAGTRLAGNTTTTLNVLTQTGDGTNSAAPAWLGTSGTGNIARTTSPTFLSPTLGSASATAINRVSITTPASLAVLTIANLKSFTCSNTLTLAGIDSSTLNIGAGGTLDTAAFTAASAYEVPLTFGSGVSRSVNAVSIDQAFANVWTAKQTIRLTTTQFEGGYDSSNKWTWTVGSTGGLTLAGTGTGGSLTLTPTAGQGTTINSDVTTTGNLTIGSFKQITNGNTQSALSSVPGAFIQTPSDSNGNSTWMMGSSANDHGAFMGFGIAPAASVGKYWIMGAYGTSTGTPVFTKSRSTESAWLIGGKTGATGGSNDTFGIYHDTTASTTCSFSLVIGIDGSNTATFAYPLISTAAGAASAPALKLTGTPFAGTGTTSFPLLYANDSAATASTTLPTAGAYIGVNGHGTANHIWTGTDGVQKFGVDSTGLITSPSATLQGTTRQLRLAYDGSNYQDFVVDSAGGLTISGTGAGGAITLKPVSGQAIYHNTGGSLTSAITGGGIRLLNGLTYAWTSGPGSVAADTSISRTSAGVVAIGNGTAGDASGSLMVNAIQTGTHTFVDAANVVVGTTTGTKIGTSTSQKIGIWNATPVVQPASANQAAITDSTGGSTSDTTIVDVGAVPLQANINNNFAKLTKLLNQLRADLVTTGLLKGAA